MSSMTYWDGTSELKISAKVVYDKIIDKTAEKCLQSVRARSPEGLRKTDKYKDGWVILKGTMKDNEYLVTVWNKSNWQLTHLLENGHLIVNKRGGVGWASARPHIQEAVNDVRPQFISDMEKADIDIEFTKG